MINRHVVSHRDILRVHKHEHPFRKPVTKTRSTHSTLDCISIEMSRNLVISTKTQPKVKWVERVFGTGFLNGCSCLCTPSSKFYVKGQTFLQQRL